MVTVVQDSKDLVKSLETGTVIEPADVLADRKGPAAAREVAKGASAVKPPGEGAAKGAAAPGAGAAAEKGGEPDPDDVEGEDGLTPRQKREYTASMQKSIARKHRQLKEAEEFAAAQYNDRRLAEGRLSVLESELATLKAAAAAQKPAPVAAPEKPTREKFESDEAYQDALVEFRVKEQLAKERREAAEQASRAEQDRQIEASRAQIARAAALVPDFNSTIEAATSKVPPHIGQYMAESDKFAELAYHFAKHPKELEQLAALPAKTFGQVMRVGVELDKISAKLRPFAPAQAAEKPDAKASNGAKPSPETRSGDPGSAANGKAAGESTPTESGKPAAGPSKPRASASVITPLPGGSEAQVEGSEGLMKPREVIANWAKDHAPQLQRRRRH